MEHGETKQRRKLSLLEMSRGRYHALKDACELLNPPADPRTLRGWITDLAIETYQSPVQRNTVLISHKNLVTLASLVGRTMKGEGTLAERRSLGKTAESATLEEVRAQHAREIAALRRQIETVQRRREQELAELEARHVQDIERLTQEIQQLKGLAGSAEKQVLPWQSPASRSVSTERVSEPPYVPPGQVKPHRLPTDLPEGSISMRSFTVPHGTTRDIMTAAAKREDIRAISRPYGGDENRTQYFLDPQMQDEAVAWLLRMGYGHRCEQCPHARETGT